MLNFLKYCGLASVGAFGPYIPEEYGGAGLDQISYGLIMQELERGATAVAQQRQFNHR
jgi:glutaryl-CoA dehydrogenase